MATFLLTWKPSAFNWTDLRELAEHVERRGSVSEDWSVAHSKQVDEGSRARRFTPG